MDNMQAGDTASRRSAGAEPVRFLVSDMTCGHCAGTVRGALDRALPGRAVSIDIAARTVTVSGEADRAADIIRAAGYSPQRLAP
jgi:copper chaperone